MISFVSYTQFSYILEYICSFWLLYGGYSFFFFLTLYASLSLTHTHTHRLISRQGPAEGSSAAGASDLLPGRTYEDGWGHEDRVDKDLDQSADLQRTQHGYVRPKTINGNAPLIYSAHCAA